MDLAKSTIVQRGKPTRIGGLFCAIWLAAGGAIGLGAETTKPNLVVILADDLGYGDLSSYGAKDIRTPNLDRMAREGLRFSRFYANSCVCSPTRAALLTGRYPELAGVPGVIRTHAENSWGWLSPPVALLPQKLKTAGYHSAIIGKWHLGLESPNTPNDRGFDFFHGFLGDMMDDYFNHLRHGQNYLRRNGEVIDPKGHATDLFTQWACEYLDTRKGLDQPFFLYLAYNAPHVPLHPRPDWLEKIVQREPGMDPKRAKLAGLIEHMDEGIGQVMATLKKNNLDQNTLVIFSSDNGGDLPAGASNGPWRAGKGTMYEGGLRVPCLANWRGRIDPGRTSDLALMTMDIFPTALELAGIVSKDPVDGVSFLPEVLGQPFKASARDLFFIRREGGQQFAGKTIEAILRGEWKLLQNSPFEPLELYNLKDDPEEKEDLTGREKQVMGRLSAALRAEIQRGGRIPWQPPTP